MAERHAPSGTVRLLEWSQLRQLVPLSRTTIWRGVRDGRFPAPIVISPGRVAWLEAEILDWISSQRRASGGEAWFAAGNVECKTEQPGGC
jgi:prophage regulatory protein